jgi:hypothetical protein
MFILHTIQIMRLAITNTDDNTFPMWIWTGLIGLLAMRRGWACRGMLQCTLLTINVPVVYMARKIMILMCGHYPVAIGRGGS